MGKLYVGYDKDEKRNETGLVVMRDAAEKAYDVCKMVLDKEADDLYKLLTDQSTKALIIPEGYTNGDVLLDLLEIDPSKGIQINPSGSEYMTVKLPVKWWNSLYERK